MTYASACSGIEAASVAWEPLGWRPAWFSEIEKFPSAVLAHRFPNVPNLGDMTKIKGDEHGAIDLLVGGTPCQDLSVAGKRMGFAGKRSVLALDFVRLAYECRAKWFVWENVPGVFSSAGGQDFAQLLSLFAGWQVDTPEGGWRSFGIVEQSPGCFGLAWRVLDVQYARVDGFPRAIPQRRNRVFVVGYLGDWRRAAQVLFEPEGLLGNTPPRREAGKGVAGGAQRGVAHSLRAQAQFSCREDSETIVIDALRNGTVRRLTPIERERLMGFPPDWTRIPWRGKPASDCPDGPRYKACGNSMGVNLMRWIGRRIQEVEEQK